MNTTTHLDTSECLAVPADAVAKLLGISKRHLAGLNSSGRLPRPSRLVRHGAGWPMNFAHGRPPVHFQGTDGESRGKVCPMTRSCPGVNFVKILAGQLGSYSQKKAMFLSEARAISILLPPPFVDMRFHDNRIRCQASPD